MEVARTRLASFDDLQTRFAPWVAIPILFAADLFCAFDHYAPWSVLLWAIGFCIAVASIGIHGLWRRGLRRTPTVAIAGFLCPVAFFFVLGPAIGVPFWIAYPMTIIPLGMASWLWFQILEW